MNGDDRDGDDEAAGPTGAPSFDNAEVERFHAEAAARTADVRRRYRHEVAVPYGAHVRQTADIYFPDDMNSARAVVVFLHGGGFRVGEPGHVGFVAEPFLLQGAVVVCLGYRLADDVMFPETSADVRQGLDWIDTQRSDWGVNASSVILGGHSSGATLAADVALRGEGPPISGLLLLSGNFRYADLPPWMVDRTHGDFVADLGEAIERLPEHTLIAYGADEGRDSVRTESRSLADALRARGGNVTVAECPATDHPGTLMRLADPTDDLDRLAIELLDRTTH